MPHYLLNTWHRRQAMRFRVVVSNPTIHNNIIYDFPHVELEKYSSARYSQEMKPLGY